MSDKPENNSISFHTFLYPLKIDSPGEIVLSKDWQEYDRSKFLTSDEFAAVDDILFVNTWRYFLPIARDFLAPTSEESGDKGKHSCSISRFFGYTNLNADSTYQITLPEGQVYTLKLTDIQFTLLEKYKVGILRIGTKYESTKSGSAFLDDVKMINVYGRRIYSTCFDATGGVFPVLTAKKIQFANKFTIEFPTSKNSSLEIDAFSKLLFDDTQTSKEIQSANKSTNKFPKIKSILDDRMFLACIVCDSKLSEYIKPEHRQYLSDESIYEFAFIDKANDCSCRSDSMLKELLQAHTYSRWINGGSSHFVSEYSFMAITSPERKYDVINPFITIYVEMAQMALLQRAILVTLEEEAEKIARNIEVEKVRELWENYIYFQNTLYMREVTFQQQGTELYDMLKRDLRIEEINDYLRQELAQFEEYSEMRNAEVQQGLTSAFTDITLIGTVNTFLAKLSNNDAWNATSCFAGIICLLASGYLSFRLLLGIVKHCQQRDTARGKGLFRVITYLLLTVALWILYWSSVWSKIFCWLCSLVSPWLI